MSVIPILIVEKYLRNLKILQLSVKIDAFLPAEGMTNGI
jgi:hypothetical protein